MGRILDTNLSIVTSIMIAIILYGSLYPFEFRVPAEGPGPVAALMQTWAHRPGRGDFISNVLLYLPLGFFGVLAVRPEAPPWARLLLVTLLGAALSIAVELTQYYDVGRDTALPDVYSNVAGTELGAIGGALFGARFRWPLLREMSANPVPTLLLAAWLGYRLFPYVPTIDLHKYWDSLKPVILTPTLPPYDAFRYTAMWLAICAIGEAIVGHGRSRLIFPLFAACVLFAKILILDKVLSVAEILGAGTAFLLWLALLAGAGPRWRVAIVALLFGAALVAQRLEPFHFAAASGPFGWIPFRSLMNGSIEVDIQAFLEKFFLYGGLIWLLTGIGLRLGLSAGLVAAILLLTSLAETYLPSRSAEITDAVMALVSAGVFALIQQAHERTGDAAPRPLPISPTPRARIS